MTPIELFNSWHFGGLMLWTRPGEPEEITIPLVLLYTTEDGFLAVPPGYQLSWPEPHERELSGPLEIKDGEIHFPEGKIIDLETILHPGAFHDWQQWQKDIQAKGRTIEQEREHYRQTSPYKITA